MTGTRKGSIMRLRRAATSGLLALRARLAAAALVLIAAGGSPDSAMAQRAVAATGTPAATAGGSDHGSVRRRTIVPKSAQPPRRPGERTLTRSPAAQPHQRHLPALRARPSRPTMPITAARTP